MPQTCKHQGIWGLALFAAWSFWSTLVLNLSSELFPSLLNSPGSQLRVWVLDNPDWVHPLPSHFNTPTFIITHCGLSLSACTSSDLNVTPATRPKGNHPRNEMDPGILPSHRQPWYFPVKLPLSACSCAVALQTIIQCQQGKNKQILVSWN